MKSPKRNTKYILLGVGIIVLAIILVKGIEAYSYSKAKSYPVYPQNITQDKVETPQNDNSNNQTDEQAREENLKAYKELQNKQKQELETAKELIKKNHPGIEIKKIDFASASMNLPQAVNIKIGSSEKEIEDKEKGNYILEGFVVYINDEQKEENIYEIVKTQAFGWGEVGIFSKY